MPLLQVQNIQQRFGKQQILHSISFDAPQGTIIAFLGPNGAGKTTLLKTVIGLHPTLKDNEQASILLHNNDITHLPVHQRVFQGLVYVPQHTSLFQQMTVHDNLFLVYHYHPSWKNEDRATFKQEMNTLLANTFVEKTLYQQARHLSGGQQRKVEVIRALLMHPKVIMFDEPFAGVDPKSIYELKKLIVDMTKKDIAVIISDHNVDQLLSLADKLYVVMNGKVVTSGTIQDILKNKHLKERYLGSQFYDEVAKRFLS
jgi:lipopolysaccharide export system ATP-binding protein